MLLSDSHYLARTLDLAARGQGHVAPNPMVGCVIVGKEGDVLSEGYHRAFGGLHAEIEAINALPSGTSLEGATVYVSLEPCAHFGRNPPCADKLVELAPARVVAASSDPNPLVEGKGFAKLREAGIEVQEGPLTCEALVQNRRFITRFWEKRPFITLKWAQTADGYLARADYSSKWITGEASRTYAHAQRGLHQAIAVGYRTALYDDPKLDTRLWPGRNPVRAVIDPQGALPAHLQMFTDGGATLHFTTGEAPPFTENLVSYRRWGVPQLGNDPLAWLQVLTDLNLHSVLIEGGAGLLQTFIDAGLWDEALVFEAPTYFGVGSIEAPLLKNVERLTQKMFGQDHLFWYGNSRAGFWTKLRATHPAFSTAATLGYL